MENYIIYVIIPMKYLRRFYGNTWKEQRFSKTYLLAFDNFNLSNLTLYNISFVYLSEYSISKL